MKQSSYILTLRCILMRRSIPAVGHFTTKWGITTTLPMCMCVIKFTRVLSFHSPQFPQVFECVRLLQSLLPIWTPVHKWKIGLCETPTMWVSDADRCDVVWFFYRLNSAWNKWIAEGLQSPGLQCVCTCHLSLVTNNQYFYIIYNNII